ncbi:hypothetical protein K8R32_04840 [bacterium]|nr:hypothetical protein [bacterium]
MVVKNKIIKDEKILPSAPQSSDRKKIRFLNIFLLKYFNLAIGAIVLVVLFFGYAYLLKPKYNDINSEIREAYELKEKEFADLEVYLSRLNIYYHSYDQVDTEKLKKIAEILPPDGSYEDLFILMENLAKDKGLALDEISIMPDNTIAGTASKNAAPKSKKDKDKLKGIGTVNITLNLVGVDYERLKDLLETLEGALRMMDIQTLTFSSSKSSVVIEITTYYKKS